MPKTQTIRCIVKNDRQSPYEAIEQVGGTNSDGSRWKQSQKQTVQEIDSGEWEYYAEGGNVRRVKVITATSRFGHRYIKTEADGEEPNNLLSLPTCP